jgi:3D (Asp-Asp-Asp) domain-containing protein
MRRILAAAFAAVAVTPATADAASTDATSYCEHGRMADGSWTRWGSAAMNGVPLGTRITLTGRSFYGRRRFIVRDRIGWGSRLDLWAPTCSMSVRWGRRTVNYKLG